VELCLTRVEVGVGETDKLGQSRNENLGELPRANQIRAVTFSSFSVTIFDYADYTTIVSVYIASIFIHTLSTSW
jgi:hypothetical protein